MIESFLHDPHEANTGPIPGKTVFSIAFNNAKTTARYVKDSPIDAPAFLDKNDRFIYPYRVLQDNDIPLGCVTECAVTDSGEVYALWIKPNVGVQTFSSSWRSRSRINPPALIAPKTRPKSIKTRAKSKKKSIKIKAKIKPIKIKASIKTRPNRGGIKKPRRQSKK